MILLKDLNNILAYMSRDLTKGHYANKIAKDLKLNQKTVSNYLHKLEKQHFLKSRTEGKNKLFFLSTYDRNMAINFIMDIEVSKAMAFLKAHPLMMDTFRKLNEALPYHLIFGSYAKGREKKGSDLDIFTVGSFNNKKIEEIEELCSIEIQIHPSKEKVFIRSLQRKDILINEILKDHIIMSGFEFFTKNFMAYYYRI